ncbi:MAG: hypothetical protein LQ345_006818 [Seirophora villosa]|nr:MAG: hypothetical protein LQ345_006818 [Seirophora villosa]
MGQASDSLFAPVATSNTNDEQAVAHNDATTIKADFGLIGPLSSGGRDTHVSAHDSGTTSPGLEVPSYGNAGAEEVPSDYGFSGFSLFRGLGQLLHSLLVLGAVDAKDRFHDAATQTEEDDVTDTGSHSSDGACSTRNQSPQARPPGMVLGAELGVNDKTPEEESAVNLHEPSSTKIGGMLDVHQKFALSQATPDKERGRREGAKPLFQSFGKPSSTPEDIQSVNFDDLYDQDDDDNPSKDCNSNSQSVYFSDYEVEDDEDDLPNTQIKPGRATWPKPARKVLKGNYRRKKPFTRKQTYQCFDWISVEDLPVRTIATARKPTGKRTHQCLDWISVEDLQVQTIAAARKPTVVLRPTRQISYHPTISDGSESESGLFFAAGDADRDALAPSNGVGKKDSP